MSDSSKTWDVDVGSHLSREERMELYGGAKYGGIEPSASTPNVFLYTDRSQGKKYGYDADGWVEEAVFNYVGEGREGDQGMADGNLAILRHRDDGRRLRLFVADGTLPERSAKNHLYLGEFETDLERPFFKAQAPDINKQMRSVFVFRLRPVGEFLRRVEDEAKAEGQRLASAVQGGVVTSSDVEVEAHITDSYVVNKQEARKARRSEAALVWRYKESLRREGRSTCRNRIDYPDSTRPMYSDLYDHSRAELLEAKGVTTRESVWMAVGQLLDYQRHVPCRSLAVLLPTEPPTDVLRFISAQRMSCVFETTSGTFRRIAPGHWPPE